jgi:hypothetical protein
VQQGTLLRGADSDGKEHAGFFGFSPMRMVHEFKAAARNGIINILKLKI